MEAPINSVFKMTNPYAGSSEDGAPQEYFCIVTKVSHNLVPSRAKNTQVG